MKNIAVATTISAAALLAAGAGSAAAAKPQDTAKPKPGVIKVTGNLKWQDVTLKRGITD